MTNEPEKDIPADPQQSTDDQQATDSLRKRPLFPPSRIALLIFAAVAAVVIVMEFRAKSAREASITAIDDKRNAEPENAEEPPRLFQKDLDGLLQGNPTRTVNSATGSEIIAWDGAVKSYRLRVRYIQGDLIAEHTKITTWRWAD